MASETNNGRFLGDLHAGVSDDEMRKRWKRGDYGKPRADYVKEWRRLAGRTQTKGKLL